ncbi:hypothetical protein J2Y48_004723 [Mycoplana sp. BE70]|uniref:hypothetical protein n=1 Tax=Mycoplana sp. BE70 TaxID=2817775 RepID=UPI00285B3CB1|nr:hypothetical protein [Mycoplana sp. BE70]MDR6759407.1 hypothetical protein [Mycoplana sp. BE70]
METELKALKDDVEDMRVKVGAIHTLLTEAKGAQKAVRFLIWLARLGVLGGAVAGWQWLSGARGGGSSGLL